MLSFSPRLAPRPRDKWLPFREFYGADRRLCYRNPRLLRRRVSPPPSCGFVGFGFVEFVDPECGGDPVSFCRLPMRTCFPFRGLFAATCDVGRSLARGHSARPTRRTGQRAPALRVLRGRARNGGHALSGFEGLQHADPELVHARQASGFLSCGMPARATGDRRRGPSLCHASTPPRTRHVPLVHAAGVVRDPAVGKGHLATLHWPWLPEPYLPDHRLWCSGCGSRCHSGHRLWRPGRGRLDPTRAGAAFARVHRPCRVHRDCHYSPFGRHPCVPG